MCEIKNLRFTFIAGLLSKREVKMAAYLAKVLFLCFCRRRPRIMWKKLRTNKNHSVRIEAATSSISLDRDRKNEAAAGQDEFLHRLLACVEGIEKGEEGREWGGGEGRGWGGGRGGDYRSAKRMEARHGMLQISIPTPSYKTAILFVGYYNGNTCLNYIKPLYS